MADARDSKSREPQAREGSTPSSGTNLRISRVPTRESGSRGGHINPWLSRLPQGRRSPAAGGRITGGRAFTRPTRPGLRRGAENEVTHA